MTDDKIYELLQRLTDKLQENTDALKEMLASHETRLAVLEDRKSGTIKDQVIVWLVKGLLIALGIIATSAGAASVLKPILGM